MCSRYTPVHRKLEELEGSLVKFQFDVGVLQMKDFLEERPRATT
jgi:hypothetical protein